MPDKFNFDDWPHWGNVFTSCIEAGCNVKNEQKWQWPEEKRKEHFIQHIMDRLPPEIEGVSSDVYIPGIIDLTELGWRNDNCITCGDPFKQKRKRGRPRVQCYVCKPEV